MLKMILFAVLLFPVIAFADNIGTSLVIEKPIILAWQQPEPACFKCVVRSYGRAYEFYVVATNSVDAEDYAVSMAAKQEAGFSLLGKQCVQTAAYNCK